MKKYIDWLIQSSVCVCSGVKGAESSGTHAPPIKTVAAEVVPRFPALEDDSFPLGMSVPSRQAPIPIDIHN